MLAALLLAFFLGGSSASGAILTQDMLKRFESVSMGVIGDPGRAKAVKEELLALRSELKQFDKTFAKSGDVLSDLYKDHDAGSKSMQAHLDLLNAEWEAAQNLALEHRFAIRDAMTKEEWATVVAHTPK